jgi:hypothetical protein
VEADLLVHLIQEIEVLPAFAVVLLDIQHMVEAQAGGYIKALFLVMPAAAVELPVEIQEPRVVLLEVLKDTPVVVAGPMTLTLMQAVVEVVPEVRESVPLAELVMAVVERYLVWYAVESQ